MIVYLTKVSPVLPTLIFGLCSLAGALESQPLFIHVDTTVLEQGLIQVKFMSCDVTSSAMALTTQSARHLCR